MADCTDCVTNSLGTSTTIAPSQAALNTRIEYWNVAESRFAGGAKMNGVDDDAPAIRAALDALRALNIPRYEGGGPRLVFPGGKLRIDSPHPTKTDRALDITGLSNVTMRGRGDGSTTFMLNGNWAFMRGDDPNTNPLFRCSIGDFAVYGPGALNHLGSTGIDLGASNDCVLEDIHLYGLRTGLAWRDAFNTELRFIKCNGQGGLACNVGFYAKDGTPRLAENSVKIVGGQIMGCLSYGFRGENITGSNVAELEVLGNGDTGVYFGDSPSGKDLKWFNWNGGQIDTNKDGLRVSKGNASKAELITFSSLWNSYAYEGLPGAGIAVEFIGLSDCTYHSAHTGNCTYAANLQDCERLSVSIGTIQRYDKDNSRSVAVIINNTSHSSIHVGSSKKASGSPSTTALVEQGSSSYNHITGVFDGAVSLINGNHSVFNGVSYA